jgi:sugar phosphate isomerase/epimerase
MTSNAVSGVESGAAPAPDAARALERALANVGVICDVEAQGKLALLLGGGESMMRLADDDIRRQAVNLARALGFSHVAVELRASPPERGSGQGVLDTDAPLPGD